jgi:hypothetical protein
MEKLAFLWCEVTAQGRASQEESWLSREGEGQGHEALGRPSGAQAREAQVRALGRIGSRVPRSGAEAAIEGGLPRRGRRARCHAPCSLQAVSCVGTHSCTSSATTRLKTTLGCLGRPACSH